MTVYKAIEVLIETKTIRKKLAEKMIFDAYYHNKIDGYEYEELIGKAEILPID